MADKIRLTDFRKSKKYKPPQERNSRSPRRQTQDHRPKKSLNQLLAKYQSIRKTIIVAPHEYEVEEEDLEHV